MRVLKETIEEILTEYRIRDQYTREELEAAIDWAIEEIDRLQDANNCYASALADRDNDLYKLRNRKTI